MNQHNIPASQSRPYQKDAIRELSSFVKWLIRGNLSEDLSSIFPNASLVEMATGSGKTFTTGKSLEHTIKLRNRYNRLLQKNILENLNIVVLTNRIDGLEQFRDDLIHGRTWEKAKPPILSQEVLDNIRSQTFHSRADDLDELVNSESDEIEETQGKMRDNFYFSTCQTANLKNLTEKLPYVDIIIIDEGHNVWGGNEFEILLKDLSTKWRDGDSPHIIVITATPSNITTELFGEPIFQFGLAEYLASPYSPRVEYKLITSTTASPDEITSLSRRIESAKSITDIPEKKRTIREIAEQFDALMAEYPDTESLVWDILHRITTEDPSGGIWPTIVFVSSIAEADRVARTINTQTGSDIALAYHSGSRTNNALTRLANPSDSTRFVIAVDMLNESIDLPTVENIVFWRGTDMARIYLQQFGRWLRWDGVVRYYDYVGGMQNFAWIGNIYTEYQSHRATNTHEGNTWSDTHNPLISDDTKFHITSSNIIGNITGVHNIDLSSMGFALGELQESIEELTQEDVINYFKENGTPEEWKIMKQQERYKIKIQWYGLTKIARILGINESPISNTDIWHMMLEKIFEVKIQKKELTQEDVKQYFRDNGSLDEWRDITLRKRSNLRIQGYELYKIAEIFWTEGNPWRTTNAWNLLLEKIFEVEIETRWELTQEKIQEYFQDNGSLEEWKNKTVVERHRLKIDGNGIARIAKIFGIIAIERNSFYTTDIWNLLLEKIFEVKIQKEELTQEDVKQYFRDNGSLEEWKNKTVVERRDLKIQWHGIRKISTIFWMTENPAARIDAWCVLLGKIFWVIIELKIEQKWELTKEKVKEYFRDHGNLEEWKIKTGKERYAIKIEGNGMAKIGSIFWIEGSIVNNTRIWYLLLEKIFWVEIKRKSISQENIKVYFQENGTLDEWKVKIGTERGVLKVDGYEITKIARIFWVEWYPIRNINVWHSLIDAIFSEETKQ